MRHQRGSGGRPGQPDCPTCEIQGRACATHQRGVAPGHGPLKEVREELGQFANDLAAWYDKVDSWE
jgi:hypothetical protein